MSKVIETGLYTATYVFMLQMKQRYFNITALCGLRLKCRYCQKARRHISKASQQLSQSLLWKPQISYVLWVLLAVVTNRHIFCDITVESAESVPSSASQSQATNQRESTCQHSAYFSAWRWMCLRNIRRLSTNQTELNPRRQNSSCHVFIGCDPRVQEVATSTE